MPASLALTPPSCHCIRSIGVDPRQTVAVLVLCPEGFIPPPPPASSVPPPPPVSRGGSKQIDKGRAQESKGEEEVFGEAGGRKYAVLHVRVEQITMIANKRCVIRPSIRPQHVDRAGVDTSLVPGWSPMHFP
jgi:predicted transcriptional regulator